MRSLSLSFGFALLLTACATSVSVSDSTDENAAKVYFIRQRAEPTAWNLGVSIDDNEVASLANNSYATFKTPSGEHAFYLKWPMLAAQTNLGGKLLFKPRESHYYLVASRYDNTLYGYKTSISLAEITKEEADVILAKMPAP